MWLPTLLFGFIITALVAIIGQVVSRGAPLMVGHYLNTLFLVRNTQKQGNTKCRNVLNMY